MGASLTIGSFSGVVEVGSRFGNAAAVLGTDPHGGRVSAWDKDAKLRAILGTSEHGGIIGVMGKEEKYAKLGVEEHGGNAAAMGKRRAVRQVLESLAMLTGKSVSMVDMGN